MIYPSADTIEDRVGSRYSLVVLAAKRAKQIKEGAPVLIETASTNPLTIALEEIAAGKVTIAQPEPIRETPVFAAPVVTSPEAEARIIAEGLVAASGGLNVDDTDN
ncbi:MAG: DNA-directed RNA polymerase subunit omega [Capsulimonadaceae bacterium]